MKRDDAGHTDVLFEENCESYALAMRRRLSEGLEVRISRDVPASGGSNPAREMLAAGGN